MGADYPSTFAPDTLGRSIAYQSDVSFKFSGPIPSSKRIAIVTAVKSGLRELHRWLVLFLGKKFLGLRRLRTFLHTHRSCENGFALP